MRSRIWWHKWAVVLICLTLFRLVIAAFLPLTPDESYYRLWALLPAAGYFDHPPMVALFIRAGMMLLGDNACGVRFMGPVSAAAGTVLLARSAEGWVYFRGGSPQQACRAALCAACLLNGTVALGVGTILMTPDTPLLFFITVLIWSVTRLFATGQGRWWLVAGLSAGLSFDSKYTAVLPVAGLVIWLFVTQSGRQWLRTVWPWAGGLFAAVLISPVVWWNMTHHWVSFIRQGGRTGDWQPAKMLTYSGELAGGQVGLASPLIFLFFAYGTWLLIRQKDALSRLWVFMLAVPLCVFVQHALGARVQANWPVVLYPLFCLAGTLPVWRWWKAAAATGGALTLCILLQAFFSPFRLSPHADVTLRQMGGWREWGQHVAKNVPADAPLIADDYSVAAELAFYLPRSRVVIGVDPRWSVFGLPQAQCGEGYLVRSHRRHDQPDPAYFSVLSSLPDIIRSRRGVIADTYSVYKVKLNCEGSALARDSFVLPVSE